MLPVSKSLTAKQRNTLLGLIAAIATCLMGATEAKYNLLGTPEHTHQALEDRMSQGERSRIADSVLLRETYKNTEDIKNRLDRLIFKELK